MTNQPSPSGATTPASRPVLLWRPDSDESQVHESLAAAAAFLGLPEGQVAAAIDSGEQLGEWFVDWEAEPGQ